MIFSLKILCHKEITQWAMMERSKPRRNISIVGRCTAPCNSPRRIGWEWGDLNLCSIMLYELLDEFPIYLATLQSLGDCWSNSLSLPNSLMLMPGFLLIIWLLLRGHSGDKPFQVEHKKPPDRTAPSTHPYSGHYHRERSCKILSLMGKDFCMRIVFWKGFFQKIYRHLKLE